jgi:hypothetical protein
MREMREMRETRERERERERERSIEREKFETLGKKEGPVTSVNFGPPLRYCENVVHYRSCILDLTRGETNLQAKRLQGEQHAIVIEGIDCSIYPTEYKGKQRCWLSRDTQGAAGPSEESNCGIGSPRDAASECWRWCGQSVGFWGSN